MVPTYCNRFARCISLIVCGALLLSMFVATPRSSAKSPRKTKPTAPVVNPQGNSQPQRQPAPRDNGRKVDPVPPQTGPPAANLPNLDELKHRKMEKPVAPPAVPSTIRSPRKALAPRNVRAGRLATNDPNNQLLRRSMISANHLAFNLRRRSRLAHHALSVNRKSSATLTPQGGSGTPYDGVAVSLPGTIEVEKYNEGGAGVAYYDATPGSHGQDYDNPPNYPTPSFRQPTDVDIYKGAGYINGYMIVLQAGDWMNYTVNVSQTASYTMTARTYYWGTPGGTFHVECDGVNVTGAVQLSGGSSWLNIVKTGVQLTAGTHVLRVVDDTNGSLGDYLGVIDCLSFGFASGPLTGTATSVPGTIEVENYDAGGAEVAYHDATAGTHGQDYDNGPLYPPPSYRQPSDVDIYKGAGYSNSHMIVFQTGDWLKYTVNVSQSGTYTFSARTYYWDAPGGTLHLEVDGVNITGPVQLPGGASWRDVTKTGLQLSAGTHVLRLVDETNGSLGDYLGCIDSLTLTLSGSGGDLFTALANPFNQPGNQLQARDCEWSLPLVSLPGRSGLDLGLTLSYSSMVWTPTGSAMYFDSDNGNPSPGFRLGFPTVGNVFFDVQANVNARMMVTSSGRHIIFRFASHGAGYDLYQSGDSSYADLVDWGSDVVLRTTDGMNLVFNQSGGELHCVLIRDRNGNEITAGYNSYGNITSVTDTLGRVLYFNYTNDNLISISQNWNGWWRNLVTFGWTTKTLHLNFSVPAIGAAENQTIPVLDWVGLMDGSHYNFEYTDRGQVNKIRRFTADGAPGLDGDIERSYTRYIYESPTNDCPRISTSLVWAENWSDRTDTNVPHEVTTLFEDFHNGWHQLTMPDGTQYKELYQLSGYQRGLTTQTEMWGKDDPSNQSSQFKKQKWTTTNWTQENPSLPYQLNPRVIETTIDDTGGNHRRTTFDYSNTSYAQWGLPYYVSEYVNNGATELRRTYTDYNLSQQYVDRHILGLVSEVKVFDVAVGAYLSKTTYGYDEVAVDSQATSATQHNQYFGSSFNARGNVTSVSRWDVNAITTASHITQVRYNAAGSVLSTTDPAQHTTTLSYADSFTYDGTNAYTPHDVLGNQIVTLAYPTTVTDADGYSSTVKYDYDFGAVRRTQNPLGAVQTATYDEAIRVQRVTQNNGAYVRYDYGPNYTTMNRSVNNVADDTFVVSIFNGLGKLFAAYGPDTNGSGGTYIEQVTLYDVMGRVARQSNPTEVDSNWAPAGDDHNGYVYTRQTYDWKGRPLDTIHETDGTVKYALYDGCGCAGGERVTIIDEVNRAQRTTSDALGRDYKSEVLTWPDANGVRSVYATTVNVFNARDQVTVGLQYAGEAASDASSTNEAASCPTGTCQKTTMSYDGYGRLQTKHVPEQRDQSDNPTYTTYSYNADDTINSVTDARGASATYVYNNNRRLVNGINYSAPSAITATANVTFGYDAAGNRTSMTDGFGGVNYTYDSLSRLRSENRGISGVGSYQISYDYNLANQLSSITDPYGVTVNYTRDATGRISEISDNSTTYASGIQYRAWGDLKHLNYGNGQALDASYNARMLTSAFTVTGMTSAMISKTYDYYSDGQLRFSSDLFDHRFDRSYGFDHAGRLTQALSGAEARGQAATNDRPYNETLTYDSFNHPTYRNVNTWSDGGVSTTDSYINNRHDSMAGTWQYDADGRMTREPEGPFMYDAAGRNITIETPVSTASTGYDGDGRQIRTEEHPISGGFDVDTTYYLRSTVLGGQVLSEFSSNGSSRTYVYAGMALLARHFRASGSDQILWERRDPSGASVKHGFAEQELEPFGADAGRSEQTVIPDEGAVATLGNSFNAANPAMTYTIDGLRTTLDNFVARMGRMANDPLQLLEMSQQEISVTPARSVPFSPNTPLRPNAIYFVPFDTVVRADIDNLNALLAALPQKPVVVALTEQQKATVKDDLAGVLKNKECEDVVEALIAQAEKNTGFKAFSHNLMDTFGKVTSFQSDGGYWNASAGSNAGSPGGIALTVNYPLSNDDPLKRNLNGRKMIHEMFHGNRDGDLTALVLTKRSYTHLDMQQAAWDVAQARGLTNDVSAGVAVFSGKRPTVDDGGSAMFGELIYKYCKTWEQP